MAFIFEGNSAMFAGMESRKLAELCRELADNRKAENIVVLDVHEVSSITDYFVIATGTSEPHLRAIVDEITEELEGKHGLTPRARDGSFQTNWIVLDYFDVIVHIMRTDAREHYNLEGLWGDVPRLKEGGKKAVKKRAPAKKKSKIVADTPTTPAEES
jgi:ribosome-associated protein